jgi:hypothetical protein
MDIPVHPTHNPRTMNESGTGQRDPWDDFVRLEGVKSFEPAWAETPPLHCAGT